MNNPKAQISLEYLILLAVVASFSFVFLVSLKTVFYSGLFALDVYNANSFLLEIQKKIDALSVFSQGSFVKTSASFFNKTSLYIQGDLLVLEITSTELSKSKQVFVTPLIQTITSVDKNSTTLNLLIVREKDFISIKNS